MTPKQRGSQSWHLWAVLLLSCGHRVTVRGRLASRFWWFHTESVLSTTLVTYLWLLGHKKGIPHETTLVATLKVYLKISFLERLLRACSSFAPLSSALDVINPILTEQGEHTD